MTATLYSSFVGQIVTEAAMCANIAAANRGIPQRKWRIPLNFPGDPLGIPSISIPYDRSDMNVAYQVAYTDGVSRIADAMAIKLQADHVGSQERAFRFRHGSAIRNTMHAANRRIGHSTPGTGVHNRMAEHVQDVIVSGFAGG